MNQRLLSILALIVLCCAWKTSSAAPPTPTYPPRFDISTGHFISVCENSSPTDVSASLAATDTSVGDTETWSVGLAATHGTVVATYTTTSTGGSLTPSGITYMPTTGYYGPDSFSVVVSDGVESDTSFFHVFINNIPFGVTITGPSDVCVGSSVTLSSLATTGVWSASNGHATVVLGVTAGISAGVDTIRYIGMNSCGSDTAYHILTVHDAADAGIISGASSVCVGSGVTLTTTGTGGAWHISNGSATLSGSVVTGAFHGVDTVTYIASNVCSADTAIHIMTVDTPSTVSMITGGGFVCVGSTVSFSDSVAGGTWSNVHTTLGNIGSTGVYTGVSAGMDTVVYTIANGCGTSAASHAITVMALPNAGTITGYDSVCGNGSTINLTTSGDAGGTWTSSSTDNAVVSSTGVVTGTLRGPVDITYTVTGPCGTATAIHHVNVNGPVAPIIGEGTLCRFSIGVLVDPSPFGTWSVDNLIVAGPGIGGTLIGLTLGTVNVSYTLNNACGTTVATLAVEVIDCGPLDVDHTSVTGTTLQMAPNPSTGAFTLTLPSATKENAQVVISNMLGQKVSEFAVATNTANEVKLNVPAGVYMLSATVNGQQLTSRIVVTE